MDDPAPVSEFIDPDGTEPDPAAALAPRTPRSEAPPAPRTPKPGYRIGPFYFVPEFGTLSRDDPWAHRKGEPRVFALLWSVYLMGSALLTLFAIGSASVPSAHQYQVGSAALLTMMALGCTLLWPLVRLSQASPERPIGAVAADLFVLLAPMQIVIWPLPLLTMWPWDIVAALAALLASWTVLTGVIVARGIASTHGASRALAMLLCVTLISGGPLLLAMMPHSLPVHERPGLWMLSPLTAIWAVIAAPSGLSPRLSQVEQLGVAAPLLLAGVLSLGMAIAGGRPGERARRGARV